MSPKCRFTLDGLILAMLLLGAAGAAAAGRIAHAQVGAPQAMGATALNPSRSPKQTSDYLGQTPPGLTPEIFAPDIISVEGRYEYGLAVSPDGDEIFFTADDPGRGLTVVRRVDDTWTTPKVANLRGNGSWEFEAFYTVDGQRLYFATIQGR